MRDLNGCSTREAANALEISTNALKSRVTRGRATLSLLLNEVIGTRPASEARPIENRADLVCRPRRSPEHREAPAYAEGPALLQAVE
jgi:hypothetical protein